MRYLEDTYRKTYRRCIRYAIRPLVDVSVLQRCARLPLLDGWFDGLFANAWYKWDEILHDWPPAPQFWLKNACHCRGSRWQTRVLNYWRWHNWPVLQELAKQLCWRTRVAAWQANSIAQGLWDHLSLGDWGHSRTLLSSSSWVVAKNWTFCTGHQDIACWESLHLEKWRVVWFSLCKISTTVGTAKHMKW